MEGPWLNNKYSLIYFAIIARAKTRGEIQSYTEMHHIVPRSIGGGDGEDNLVKLTAREHFVCHRLLTRMTTGDARHRMAYAAYMMMFGSRHHQREFKVTARTYEKLSEAARAATSALTKGKPKHTPKSKARLAESARNQPRRLGKVVSAETRDKISKANKGRKHTDSTREKMSNAHRGRKKSHETRRKMSDYWRGKERQPHTEETKKRISGSLQGRVASTQVLKLCEHCGKTVMGCHYGRWHGAKCKSRKV